MSQNLLKEFSNRPEAEMARNFLKDNGIETAWLSEESKYLPSVQLTLKLFVQDHEMQEAKRLLDEIMPGEQVTIDPKDLEEIMDEVGDEPPLPLWNIFARAVALITLAVIVYTLWRRGR